MGREGRDEESAALEEGRRKRRPYGIASSAAERLSPINRPALQGRFGPRGSPSRRGPSLPPQRGPPGPPSAGPLRGRHMSTSQDAEAIKKAPPPPPGATAGVLQSGAYLGGWPCCPCWECIAACPAIAAAPAFWDACACSGVGGAPGLASSDLEPHPAVSAVRKPASASAAVEVLSHRRVIVLPFRGPAPQLMLNVAAGLLVPSKVPLVPAAVLSWICLSVWLAALVPGETWEGRRYFA